MHQNRASPFASDFYRRRGYRRRFRSEDHFYPFSSQKKSRFASDFLRGGNRASWGLKNPKDPAVLKILRVVNLLRVVFLVRRGDLLSWRALCGHQFPGNCTHFSSQGRVRGVLHLGGVVKTVRHSNSQFLLSP